MPLALGLLDAHVGERRVGVRRVRLVPLALCRQAIPAGGVGLDRLALGKVRGGLAVAEVPNKPLAGP